jgi:hypothetical protein
MINSLDDRIEEYLNGSLSEEETKRFEEKLLDEEVAAQFREVLFMRELLRDIPPDSPPPGLVRRIEKSLMLEKRQVTVEVGREKSSGFGQITNAFRQSLSWPKHMFSGITGGTGVVKDSLSGMNTVTYSLGPLREPARKRVRSIKLPDKPLWQIALSFLL